MASLVVCGILCNDDIALAELMARYGFLVKVLRDQSQQASPQEALPGRLKFFSYDNIEYVKTSWEFFKKCQNADLVLSINGYYPSMLNLKTRLWSFFTKKKPKVINFTCGSDITELVVSNTRAGRLYKNHLKSSLFNYISPYTYAISNLFKIDLQNFMFARFNYYLLGPLEIPCPKGDESPLLFFHPSNLDWGCIDATPGRNSLKGNDKFLRSFIRAVDQGLNAKCVILDRGPDREEAKNIVNQSKYAACFEWRGHLTPAQLRKQMCEADVVVDQFYVGGFGGVAYEAMAQAKPVMIYIDKNCWPLVYADEPPIINCYTEDDIYTALMAWADRKKLQELGARAEKWVRKYHDVQTADFSEFILRVCIAAGLPWPRPDLAKSV